jgi:hypothetical protein
MRKLLLTLWLIAPIGMLSYHYGPGQEKLARDRAAQQLAIAQKAEKGDDWKTANAAYAQALINLPANDTSPRLSIRLAQAKSRMYLGELPEAMEDTESLLQDALKDSADAKLVNQIRTAAASMHYYVAWLMRLEGADKSEWTEQTEDARQHFRLLAENASAEQSTDTQPQEKNLESVIRLARMDLSELKGLPLPKECKGNSNCSGKCRSQKQSRSQVAKKPSDARQQISEDKKKGAGKNDRPDGGS